MAAWICIVFSQTIKESLKIIETKLGINGIYITLMGSTDDYW